MGPTVKLEFAKKTALRYKTAQNSEESKILNEFCATFDYNRKYAIRKLGALANQRRSKISKINSWIQENGQSTSGS